MRTRRWLWAGSACSLAALATGLALTANGQDASAPPTTAPAPAQPKYYQGKVSPPPPGLFPTKSTQPPAGSARPLPFGQTPPAFNQSAPAGQRSPITYPNNSVQQSGGFPKLAQPVMAGPNGVRQVRADEPAAAPPFFNPKPQPTNGKETSGLPEPKPLAPVAGPDLQPPVPSFPVPAPSFPTTTPEPMTTPAPVTLPVQTAPAPVTPLAVSPPPAIFMEPAAINLPTNTTSTAKVETSKQPMSPAVTTAPPLAPAVAPSALPNTMTMPQTALPARISPNLMLEALIPETIGVGQTLVYELVVRNIGTMPATNVRIEDDLPAKCAYISAEPTAEANGNRLAWNFGTMEVGAEKRIKITVKPMEEGDVRSRASVSFSSAMEARTRITRPKIVLTMTAPESARVGDKVPFQIKLSNEGSGTAGKVSLRAEFSEGLNHAQGQVIEAELAGLPAGQSKMLNLEAIAGKAGKQLCKLSAIADGQQTELANATTNLVEPLLTIKQAGPAKCLVNSEPTFTIELSNPGTAATDPIQLWASLPAGLEFVNATDAGAFLEANRAIGWRLPALPAGGTKTVSIKLKATAPSEGLIRTLAQAAGVQSEIVQVESRNGAAMPTATPRTLEARAESMVKAEGVPALRFEVFDQEDPVVIGAEATYEIRVINQGTGACTNVQLVAEVAETTSPVNVTGPTGNRVEGRQIIFEPIAQFQVKGEAVYKVRVKGTQPGDYRFRVRLSCDQIRTPTIKEENTRFYKE